LSLWEENASGRRLEFLACSLLHLLPKINQWPFSDARLSRPEEEKMANFCLPMIFVIDIALAELRQFSSLDRNVGYYALKAVISMAEPMYRNHSSGLVMVHEHYSDLDAWNYPLAPPIYREMVQKFIALWASHHTYPATKQPFLEVAQKMVEHAAHLLAYRDFSGPNFRRIQGDQEEIWHRGSWQTPEVCRACVLTQMTCYLTDVPTEIGFEVVKQARNAIGNEYGWEWPIDPDYGNELHLVLLDIGHRLRKPAEEMDWPKREPVF